MPHPAKLAAAIALCIAALFAHAGALANPEVGPEAFDGSFRMEDGTVLTGGRFVEGGRVYYLYLDTDHPETGALFERQDGGTILRALPLGPDAESAPPIEMEFLPGGEGYDRVIWRDNEEEAGGVRVYPHRSEPVSFTSEDGTRLEGRLLVPRCPGPHPLVVSVHGSGPVNRYGGTYHLFFLREGMAVLAYDKRGYTSDPDAWHEPDMAEMSADAAAAVRFGAAQDGIDTDRIGLFGSSQGGWTAPPAAIAAEETDFLIERAGAALTQAETIVHERRQEWRAEGMTGIPLDNATALARELYAMAAAGRPIAGTDTIVAPYLETEWYRQAFGDKPISEDWSDRWWSWANRNLASTPLPALERFDGPVLWMLGEMDQNVPLVSTHAALQRAFARSPSEDEQIQVIPGTPHSFIVEGEDGKLQLSPLFFGGMAEWMEERGLSEPGCWGAEDG